MTSQEKHTVHLILDTEFTDFVDCNLISIALKSTCKQHSFYREVSDFPKSACSPFVNSVILPLLEGGECSKSYDTVSTELSVWLLNILESSDVVIWADYAGDWHLFHDCVPFEAKNCTGKFIHYGGELLSSAQPLTDKAVYDKFMNRRAEYYAKFDNRQHHAMVDVDAYLYAIKNT